MLLRAVSEETRERLTAVIRSPEVRATVARATERHNALWQARMASSARGEVFRLPQLAFAFQGERELAEPETLLDALSWSLSDYSAELSPAELSLTENSAQWEIDLRDGHLTQKHLASADQHNLALVDTGWTQNQLIQ